MITTNIKKNLLKVIEEKILYLAEDLITEGCKSGNWDDVRGTGDVLIALNELLSNNSYKKLKESAVNFIENKVIESGEMCSWEEEVWDTSIALIGLCNSKNPNKNLIIKSTNWLYKTYSEKENSWYSEPWETLWALIAISEAIKVSPDLKHLFNPKKSILWLLSLYDKDKEKLINYHYTALFLILCTKWETDERICLEDNHILEMMRVAKVNSVDSFLIFLKNNSKELWSTDVWSNALVLWSLCDIGGLECEEDVIKKIMLWFHDNIKFETPTEDKAFTLVSLIKLYICTDKKSSELIPKSILALDRHNPDPTLKLILDHYLDLDNERSIAEFKFKFEPLISGLNDYNEKPPFFERGIHNGYYSFNIKEKNANILIILLTAFLLTMITGYSALFSNSKYFVFLSMIPILLGMLATIAQIFDIHLKELFKRK